jgi:hypothetical protein
MKGYLKTRNGVPTEVVVRNISVPAYDVYVYCDSEGFDGVSTYTCNGASISGVMDIEEWPIATGGGVFTLVSASNNAGNCVVFRNVSGPTVTITAANTGPDFRAPVNGVQIVRATEDTDGDGMPNAWESTNGLNPSVNDAAGDLDSDGSTNLAEYQRLTNPQDNDSDDDTLLDGVETDTGNYVSASNTGTDPLKADTDGDGFGDAVENNSGTFVDATNPGTDPNRVDTDGDSFTDTEEVSLGSNPVVASNYPVLPIPIGYWPFNDQEDNTADLSPGAHPGIVIGSFAWVPGASGAPGDYAIQFNGIDVAVTTGFPLLDGLNAYTMAGWVNFSVDQPDRTGLWGANDTLEFGMANLNTLGAWTPTGGQVDVMFGPSSNGWRHLAVADDGLNKRVYVDGLLAATGAPGVPTSINGTNFNIGGNGVWDATDNWFNGVIDDVAVWDRALGPTHLRQLANRLIVPYDPAAEIPVTSVSYNGAAGTFSFTFASIPGRTYSVFRGTSPGNLALLNNNVAATGTSTTFNDNPGAAAKRYVYQARLNP